MKLLMLGGTEFVGRAIAEAALARGWQVSVFHRGHHAPPAGATALHGDRADAEGLKALREGEWDAVVDTWSGAPAAVRDAARLLAGRARTYAYVSSRSVYAYPAPAGLDEEGPVVEASPDATDADDYAQAKRGGELAAVDAFGDRALLVRAGLILGPYENIGRLPWWLDRIARGGTVLAPGPRELALQYIDVRDLAQWTLDAVQGGLGGAYNLVSEPGTRHHGGAAGELRARHRLGCRAALDGAAGRARRRYRALVGAAGLAAGGRGARHHVRRRCLQGPCRRPALPSCRRDGGRYLGLAAEHRRSGAATPGPPGGRPRPGEGGGGAAGHDELTRAARAVCTARAAETFVARAAEA